MPRAVSRWVLHHVRMVARLRWGGRQALDALLGDEVPKANRPGDSDNLRQTEQDRPAQARVTAVRRNTTPSRYQGKSVWAGDPRCIPDDQRLATVAPPGGRRQWSCAAAADRHLRTNAHRELHCARHATSMRNAVRGVRYTCGRPDRARHCSSGSDIVAEESGPCDTQSPSV